MDFLFIFCYILFAVCLFPPPEFVSAGLTVESIFSPWLKNEHDSFINYHMKRIVVAYCVRCFIPLIGFIAVNYSQLDNLFSDDNITLTTAIASLVGLLISFFPLIPVYRWCRQGWSNHPVARNLKCFLTGDGTIDDVAKNIDEEFRSVNKIIIKCSPTTRLVVTDNWIIKIKPCELRIAHQSDTTAVVKSSESHPYIPDMSEAGEYLTIEVKSSRANVESFWIRLNSLDFKDLQDKMARPVLIPSDIVVNGSLTDSFLKVFKENIQKNPKIIAPENQDPCIGCLAEKPNVKISTCCGDTTGPNKCTMCYCKPLWCENCMGKWFASRQDQDQPDSWLSSKCKCPMCRSTFCVLDVCPLDFGTEQENGGNKAHED